MNTIDYLQCGREKGRKGVEDAATQRKMEGRWKQSNGGVH